MTTNDVTDSIWSLQVIIIYDASWEKVFHSQQFHLKQVLNLESIKFLLSLINPGGSCLRPNKWITDWLTNMGIKGWMKESISERGNRWTNECQWMNEWGSVTEKGHVV